MTTRVLLAEDNIQLAQMLGSFLASQEIEAVTATTGVEVMRRLSEGRFDLLLLDLKMPEPNGIQILQKIRQSPALASLPVIIMTGVYKGERNAQAAEKLGVQHYLEKPFTRQDFLDAVQSVLPKPAPKTEETTLCTLILEIYKEGKSGLLQLPQGVTAVFVNGEPVSFISKGGEAFRAYLVSIGKIDGKDARDLAASEDNRLFLTQVGLLPYETLIETSRMFLVGAILSALRERKGFSFEETASPILEDPITPLSVPRLMYEAVREEALPCDAGTFLAAHAGRYAVRTTGFYRLTNLIPMHREDLEFLGKLNPRRPLGEIIAATDSSRACVNFYNFLALMGMIRLDTSPSADEKPDFPQKIMFNRPFEEGPAEEMEIGFDDLVEEVSDTLELVVGTADMAAPLSSDDINFEQAVQREYAGIQNKNYYEIFGLTPKSFSFNALKEAYFAKTRQYSPEKFMALSGNTMSLAQEILSHYANAYNTLSSIVAKERYDEMLNADKTVGLDGKQDDKLQARIQFQSGSVFLDMGEYENAEKALQEAYTLEPDNAAHCALLAAAIYRNPVNTGSKAAVEKAKMLLAKSLQIDKNAQAYALRGLILMDEGREGLAEGEFQKALKLNPKDAGARQGLKMITERREAEKKGLFKRIFS